MASRVLLLLALLSSSDAATVRSLLDAGRYPEAEAAARTLGERLSADPQADPFQAAEAVNLLVEALRRSGRSREDATLELARGAVARWEALVAPDDIRVTPSLSNLALILTARADLDRKSVV